MNKLKVSKASLSLLRTWGLLVFAFLAQAGGFMGFMLVMIPISNRNVFSV
jgi:hypothetical protein